MRYVNIYCDESRVENPESRRMVIGAVLIPRNAVRKISSQIKDLFSRHGFEHELKWVKAGKLYEELYIELINLFWDSTDLKYRAIIVDKCQVDYEKYHGSDEELAFFKFYYLMLKQKLLSGTRYYIFLDKKPTRDKNITRALKHYLDAHTLFNLDRCSIKHLQAYPSDENVLIQLSDFLTGLLGYACNTGQEYNSSKGELVKKMTERSGKENLCTSSPLSEGKYNIFVWKG